MELVKRLQPILRELFFKNTGFEELRIPGSELLGMQPDIIGRNGKTLILGEITVSGYMGKNKKNFHIGGTRKLAEAFLKLHILKGRLAEINIELKSDFECIQIYFVYPEKSRFMNALGYREKIFKKDLVRFGIPIDPITEGKISEVYERANREIGKRT